MRAAALTCRSHFSLLRGAVSPARWVEAAAAAGYGAAAIADTNSLYGIVEFYKAAKEAGIKPIIGAEILTETQRAIFLIEEEKGYSNLCRLITASNLDSKFEIARELEKGSGGLICICSDEELISRLKGFFDRASFFYGCKNSDDAARAKRAGVEPVCSCDFNVIEEDDVIRAKIVSRVRQMSTDGPGPADRCGINHLISEQVLRERFSFSKKAIFNAEQIMLRCNFELMTGKYHFPKVRLEGNRDGDSRLAKLCHVLLPKKYSPIGHNIIKRLENELNVIKQNKFSDYFLLVYEIVNFAKSRGIPVEIRGSAAGSLVAHVLGFTRVCPVKWDLYFERFMNPGRKDCPDIDIDLCWRGRDEVIQFCYDHWGAQNVAMICTVNTYRYKGAIRDVGRYLTMEPAHINELVANRRTPGDSIVYQLAKKIVGMPRHIGIHCGGIVITPTPVGELAPLQTTNKGVIVTQFEKDSAEAVGLIKIDLLGNRALSTVNETVKIINSGRGEGERLNIDTIDQSDSKTGRMLTAGKSLGIFQCESPGMKQLLTGLKVKDQKDIMIALSLIRPGPASGGMKKEFIERHRNKKPFKYLHPSLANVLADTYGLLLFQEDVMKIAVKIAGYTLAEANEFRTDVSKRVSGVKLGQQYNDFVYHKAAAAGIDRDTAEQIWEQVLKFAAYSYCKAHATVYANIAWQTAFLKAHFPVEFYTSLFNNHHGMYPLRVYVWDAIRQGIKVMGPHVNYSGAEWQREGKAIRAGLGIVGHLSYSTIRQILEQRARRPFIDLDDLRARVKFHKPELQNLIHIGACEGLGASRPSMLMSLHRNVKEPGQMLLFDVYKPACTKLPDYDRFAKLKAEVDVTGIPLTMHPAAALNIAHTLAAELHKNVEREVTLAGFVATARTARAENGDTIGFATIEDASGMAEVTFFAKQIGNYYKICSTAGPVWVRGKVSEHMSGLTIDCVSCGPVRMAS